MRGISSHILVFLLVLLVAPLSGQAQTSEPILDLSIPQNYRIAGLTVLGAEYTDVQAVKLFSALQVGNTITIPGEEIPRAIRNLWDQDLFSDFAFANTFSKVLFIVSFIF